MSLPFPNVPAAPGVPQLPRSPAFPPDPTPSIGAPAAGGLLWGQAATSGVWGVFDSAGNQVLAPDSIVDFDVRQEWRLSDYPVQAGSQNQTSGFSTFNKVVLPGETPFRMSKGGSESDRAAFVQQVETIAGSIALYTIMTPERSYANMNAMRYEISRRGGEGAFWFSDVEMVFRQINQTQAQYTTSTANTTNAQQPADQPPQSQGNVQAQAPSGAVATNAALAVALNTPPN